MPNPVFWGKLTFPNSLRKLEIEEFAADEILEKIGWLPFLVKLKLKRGCFDKHKWVTVEGQFPKLRFLLLQECYHLQWWKTESSHFPHLEHLTVWDVKDLKEIPLDIGEIPTLRSIHVRGCKDSVVASAKTIQEEQEELGNEDLQLHFP